MRKLLLSLLVLLIVLVAVVAALPWLAGPGLRLGLRAAGFEDVAFAQVRLRPDRLEVARLTLGAPPGHEVGRLEVRYRPGELLQGRVRSVTLEDVVVRGSLTEDGLQLAGLEGNGGAGELPELPLPEELLIRDARLELATPAGELIVPVRAELRPRADRADFLLAIEQVRLARAAGALAADLQLEGWVPLPRPSLADLVAEGQLRLAAEELELPGLGRGITGAGTVALQVAEGRLQADTSDLQVQLGVLAPELESLAATLPAPWRVQVGTSETPLGLVATRRDDGVLVEVSGPATLAADGPRLETSFAATLAFDDDLALREVRPRSAALSGTDLRWQGLSFPRAGLTLEAEGTLRDLEGTLRVHLEGDGELAPDLAFSGLALEQTLVLALSPEQLALTLQPGGSLRLDGLAWADRLRGSGIAARLEPAEQPLLTARLEDGRLVSWRYALMAALDADVLTVAAAAETVELGGATQRLHLDLTGTGGSVAEGTIGVVDGRARVPERQIGLHGIATEVALGGAGLVPDQIIPLAVAQISHEAPAPWFPPLRLQAELRPAPERIGFSGRISAADGRIELVASGAHDPTSGRGEAAIEVPLVTFAPGGLQPGDVASALGDAVQRVSGQAALEGEIAWHGGEITGDLELLLDSLALDAGPVRIEGINGLISFDRIWPIGTPPLQQLVIGLVDFGLPLTNGFMIFQIQPGPEAQVSQLRFRWADGRVRAEPFTVRSGVTALSVTLRAEQLNLAQLLALVRLPGVTGEGTIRGTIPVRIEGGEATIRRGELVSDTPGWLRYRPNDQPAAFDAGGEGMDLLLQALENFRYEQLRITLDGRTDAEMDIGLHISGANPELYGGHPVEFNLNVEGELANILRDALTGYAVPERIRERMEGLRR